MLRLTVGLLLALATWLAVRRAVGAPAAGAPDPHRAAMLAIDAVPPLIGFALFLAPTGRPILSGLGIAALGFGLIVADREKRRILDEPVVFADRAELIEVARHPRLYLAFIGLPGAIAVFAAILLAIGGIFRLEPPLWPTPPADIALAAAAAAIAGRLCFVLPALAAPALARLYGRFEPARSPEGDMRRLGPFTTLIAYATIARAERPARRAAAMAKTPPPLAAGQGPIVLVQAESFVDATILHPALAAHLPHFTALKGHAMISGRLAVPCWGANTIRTELAVLASLDDGALGLDRFNPYEHFALAPLPGLASAARAGGYRTIFVHPYSRRFYARHKVMPALGFERFHGVEAFAGAPRDAGYVTDAAVADFVADLIAREGPDLFVFVVTMENHGPWTARHDPLPPASLPEAWRGLPDADAIGRWLRHLAATDAMIGRLRATFAERGRGWLGVYGDHQPSLAGPFHGPDAPDRRTDYALWSPLQAGGGMRADLAAHELGARLATLIATAPRRP